MRLNLSNNTRHGNGKNKRGKPKNANGNPTKNLAFVRVVKEQVACWQVQADGKTADSVEALAFSNLSPEDGKILLMRWIICGDDEY